MSVEGFNCLNKVNGKRKNKQSMIMEQEAVGN